MSEYEYDETGGVDPAAVADETAGVESVEPATLEPDQPAEGLPVSKWNFDANGAPADMATFKAVAAHLDRSPGAQEMRVVESLANAALEQQGREMLSGQLAAAAEKLGGTIHDGDTAVNLAESFFDKAVRAGEPVEDAIAFAVTEAARVASGRQDYKDIVNRYSVIGRGQKLSPDWKRDR